MTKNQQLVAKELPSSSVAGRSSRGSAYLSSSTIEHVVRIDTGRGSKIKIIELDEFIRFLQNKAEEKAKGQVLKADIKKLERVVREAQQIMEKTIADMEDEEDIADCKEAMEEIKRGEKGIDWKDIKAECGL